MNKQQRLAFLKRMHMLLKAGISLETCFTSQSTHSSIKISKIMTTAHQELQQGTHISDIFELTLKYDPLSVALIAAGEQSGTLSINIKSAATTLEKRQKLQQTIISSLFYPIIIASITIVLSVFLLFVIFPKIKPLFTSFKMKLPWSTQFLVSLSTFLLSYGIYLLVLIIGSSLLYLYLIKKHPRFVAKRDMVLLKIPGLKTFILLYQNAHITRSLGVMLEGNLPLDKAIMLTKHTVFHTVYKDMLSHIHQALFEGSSLSVSINKYPHLLPQEITLLIETAEASGTLPETLLYCSELLDEQLENLSKIYSRMLEPILMIAMGLIVGFVALSMLSPLYNITQNVPH